ncbi:uncharacterized protein LAESUDRAFT_728928 [Laetiporus sulphureus 93-53]|uniref:Uncharacterized protein n=1 Tax=Laetiporus sulphureus 93-53 TaxID=1314785 RepID=A0A165CX86_9APHY|nr:uncharacterized protein LAESUDRAFT_728928 [Laetiporus sulphureus 93-53]KZT03645.1 hypothetical protein LAESUDRAFT_728928 [Laetiporus sulphureus 93-53]
MVLDPTIYLQHKSRRSNPYLEKECSHALLVCLGLGIAATLSAFHSHFHNLCSPDIANPPPCLRSQLDPEHAGCESLPLPMFPISVDRAGLLLPPPTRESASRC